MFCYCFLLESVDTCSQPLESSTSTHVIITIDIMSVILYDFISGPRSKSALLTPLTSRATIHIIAYLSCIYSCLCFYLSRRELSLFVWSWLQSTCMWKIYFVRELCGIRLLAYMMVFVISFWYIIFQDFLPLFCVTRNLHGKFCRIGEI